MSHYLLLFTFSPVQEFISQARKTQDLYAGSYILSHLCKTVLEKAREEYQVEIIYPNKGSKSYPNRFIGVLSGEENKLAEIGQDLQEIAEEEFLKIGKGILDQVLNEVGDKNKEIMNDLKMLKEDFEKQLKSYLQIYWLFKKITRENYQEAYNEIESLLGSIKNTRTFQQLPEQGRKCSLTTEYNVLLYRQKDIDPSIKNRDNPVDLKKGLKPWDIVDYALNIPVSSKAPDKLLQPGEGLGGIAFVKRFAEIYFKNSEDFVPNFPSTAEVALFDVFDKLKSVDEQTFIITEKKDFKIQAIFNLKNNEELSSDLSNEQKNDVKKVFGKLKEKKINITPYYALIMFDADSMGEFLSGSTLKEGVDLKEFHQTLSKQLAEYAVKAQNILAHPRGKAVYAGGDDFLGFVNLSYLFKVLKELREKFGEIDLEGFTDRKLTFSAGIVIAHFKTPLSEVLKRTKKMEISAKKIGVDKDAFGLAVVKHSGETVQAVYKWKCDNQLTTDLLEEINKKLTEDFSDTFIRNISIVFNKLLDKEGAILSWDIQDNISKKSGGKVPITEREIVYPEIKRLVNKAYLHNGDNEKVTEHKLAQAEKLVERLKLLYKNKNTTADFLALLNIIAFIKKKVKS